MSKQVINIVVITILALICIFDFVRIGKLQSELEQARSQIDEEFEALNKKLDANIYKKDAQMLLMNRCYGNANVHKLLADSCYNDCQKYRVKYGKEVSE